jgi:CheY-like chemotaxis protein
MRSNGYGGPNMPNIRKILIVDDDPQLRDARTEQLSLHEEFETAAAENGTQGVQVAKEGQIDLAIMDVGLPDIDGREAVRILRRNGFKAPIIMLTGHDTDSVGSPSYSRTGPCQLYDRGRGRPRPIPLHRRATQSLAHDVRRHSTEGPDQGHSAAG